MEESRINYECSVRLFNLLRAVELKMEDLTILDPDVLMCVRGFGKTLLNEVKTRLYENGLMPGTWRMKDRQESLRYYLKNKDQIKAIQVMNKSMKPSTPARPKELTPEEKEQMQLRAIAQKREAFAQMAFAGLVQNPAIEHIAIITASMNGASFKESRSVDLTPVVKAAVKAADTLIEELYGKAIKVENIEK